MKNYSKLAFAIGLFFLLNLQVNAQCSLNSVNANLDKSQMGQSITTPSDYLGGVSCTAGNAFDVFRIYRSPGTPDGTTGTIEIFDGESVDPANLIYTQNITLAPTANVYTFVDIPLDGGTGTTVFETDHQYTFLITTNESFIYACESRNFFPTGKMYLDGAFSDNLDMWFKVTSKEVVVPLVPTMGEWALITFGLLIMSISVVYVMKWQMSEKKELVNA